MVGTPIQLCNVGGTTTQARPAEGEVTRCNQWFGAILSASILLLGCAEKKTCYYQCYEPALDGFGTSCGMAEKLTKEECSTMFCNHEGEEVRHSWGEVASWCSDDPERYR